MAQQRPGRTRTRNRPLRRNRAFFALALVFALVAAACGDDGGGADDASSDTSSTTTGAPRTGGEMTALLFNEIGSVDPVTATGAAGADGQRMFAFYGALLVYDAEANDTEPILAESFEPNTTFDVWTLTLRGDLVFSDGTPMNADAVLANWQRAKDPANRSQAIGLANSMSQVRVTSPTTLEVTLATPNAHFDNSIARQALNYIASPAAISGGQLATTPVGAGPFLLESWTRDDRMVLVPNPDWRGSDGPYLDRLTFRIIGDEEQRVDTFVTGDADLFYTAAPRSVDAAKAASGTYVYVGVSGGGTVIFNTARPPFDDVRIRRAVAIGVDAAALTDVVRPGAIVATNPMLDTTPWYAPEADYPEYDPQEAQRLIDEYRADTGADVRITLGSFQQTENVATAKFIQTALEQLEGVDVEVDVADAPTATQRVLQRNYQAHMWGFPVLDPDPGLYNALRSGLPTNVTGYANSEVDALLDEARITADNAERSELIHQVLVQYVEDMPFWHTLHPTFGYVHSDDVTGVELYEDGNLRVDLLRFQG